jgi:hypothetical protein
MTSWQLKTPVAFLIFNRPDTTERVFDTIRRVRPPKLLVVADGPRADRMDDAEKCAAARAVIDCVDWDCIVMKNYSEENMGCKRRVSSGLDWVFDNVGEAIILEDDCLPHPDFYRFCEMMLEHYRHDTRVMMICGTNYLLNVTTMTESYFFANYYPIWGWATWRRAWEMYQVDMKAWDSFDKKKQLRWIFGHKEIAQYYENMFQLIHDDFDTWDIQWWFACIFQHGLAIIPRTNLIANLGVSGTHTQTQGNLYTNMPTYPLDVNNIRHPEYIVPDVVLNRLTYEWSHAGLDLSIKTALKKRKFKSMLRVLIPDRAFRFIVKLRKQLKPSVDP